MSYRVTFDLSSSSSSSSSRSRSSSSSLSTSSAGCQTDDTMFQQVGATPPWALTLLVGREPEQLLLESELFVPCHDQWRPQEGPKRLLQEDRPRTIFVAHKNFSDGQGHYIEKQLEGKRLTTLNLVVDLAGMEGHHFRGTMRGLKIFVPILAKSLTVFKIWIRGSRRFTDGVTKRASYDLEDAVMKDFFGIFAQKEDETYLFSNLEHLWIDIREDFDGLPRIGKQNWDDLPEEYLQEQTNLTEFVFNSSHRLIRFPPEGQTSHRFYYEIPTEQSPQKLAVDYTKRNVAYWAPYMTKMVLVSATKVDELCNIWSRFQSLTHLHIFLQLDILNFVQLVHSLGTARGRIRLKVLQVDICHSILNPKHVQIYSQSNRLHPLTSIEVVILVKHNFSHHDQIDLHGETFAGLFPNLNVFTLAVQDGRCTVCGKSTRFCVYKYGIEPLRHCQKLKAWSITLKNRNENLQLDFSMPIKEVSEQNWFDLNLNQHIFPLESMNSQGTSDDDQECCFDGAPNELTLLVGGNPLRVLSASGLFAPLHDRWEPESGPQSLLKPGNNPMMVHKQLPMLTLQDRESILSEVEHTNITKLNLVLDLFRMAKDQVCTTMQEAKELLSSLGTSLVSLKIWIRTSVRVVEGPVIDIPDLDMPIMDDFFGVFTLGFWVGQSLYLLNNLKYIWIDSQEEYDTQLLMDPSKYSLPELSSFLGAKEFVPQQYLMDQTNLFDFVLHSTNRSVVFRPETYPESVHLFFYRIFVREYPEKLYTEYKRPEMVRWAQYVTMITLDSTYTLRALDNLWTTFLSLTRLRITLNSEDFSFDQLIRSLSTAFRQQHLVYLHSLQVRITYFNAQLINPNQFYDLANKRSVISALSNIELLSIEKTNLTNPNEVNLYDETFSNLFPNLRLFILGLKDGGCHQEWDQCSQYVPECIYGAVRVPLVHCPKLTDWVIVYKHRFGKHVLDSTLGDNWKYSR